MLERQSLALFVGHIVALPSLDHRPHTRTRVGSCVPPKGVSPCTRALHGSGASVALSSSRRAHQDSAEQRSQHSMSAAEVCRPHPASPTAHAVGGRTAKEVADNPSNSSTATAELDDPHREGTEDRRGAGGSGQHNWCDDIKAVLGVRKPEQRCVEVGRTKARTKQSTEQPLRQSMPLKPTTTRQSTQTSWCARTASRDQSPEDAGNMDRRHGGN